MESKKKHHEIFPAGTIFVAQQNFSMLSLTGGVIKNGEKIVLVNRSFSLVYMLREDGSLFREIRGMLGRESYYKVWK